jgi:hypothetical protein
MSYRIAQTGLVGVAVIAVGFTARAGAGEYEQTIHRAIQQLDEEIARTDARLASATGGTSGTRGEWLKRRMRLIFERTVLRGDSFESLEQAAGEALEADPDGPAGAAATYWLLRIELTRLAETPATAATDDLRIRRTIQFVRRHQQDYSCIGLVEEALRLAYTVRDFAAADRLLSLLRRNAPNDVRLTAVLGQDRLRRALGETWAPLLRSADGAPVDWRGLNDRPVLVVFWASWDTASRRLLSELNDYNTFRNQQRPQLMLVSLDENAESASAALARHSIAAIDAREPHGWAAPTANDWGIRILPAVLVLDKEGRLRHFAQGPSRRLLSDVEKTWRGLGGTLDRSDPPGTMPTRVGRNDCEGFAIESGPGRT